MPGIEWGRAFLEQKKELYPINSTQVICKFSKDEVLVSPSHSMVNPMLMEKLRELGKASEKKTGPSRQGTAINISPGKSMSQVAVTAGPSGLGRRKQAARWKLPWDDKSDKDDDIDSEEEEEMKEVSEEEEEEAFQAEVEDEPEPTEEEETSGKVGIPVHEGMYVVVGLEGKNRMEWNIKFWPKAKHWDPMGHSVPWKGRKLIQMTLMLRK